MSGMWANNLDMLAQSGVIDFDAPAYIYGQNPRYIGNPQDVTPFNQALPKPIIAEQPKVDEFQPEKQGKDGSLVKNPFWKKALFTTLALGALVFGGYKCKKALGKALTSIKKFFKHKKGSKSSVKSDLSGSSGKAKTKIGKGWKKFIGLFKKKS